MFVLLRIPRLNKPCSHHAITRCMPVGTVSKIAMWAELHTHTIYMQDDDVNTHVFSQNGACILQNAVKGIASYS